MKKENQNLEELKTESENSERAKISLPETIILIMLSGIADAFEFFSGLSFPVPIIGQVVWLIAFAFGIFISTIIILWSIFRGAKGRFVIKRLVILTISFLFDAATAGVLPIRTIALAITIWLNNHLEEKNLQRVLALLGKIK